MAPGMSSFSATITSSTAPCVAAAPPHPRARHSLPQAARLQCKGSSCSSSSKQQLLFQLSLSILHLQHLDCIALHCIAFNSHASSLGFFYWSISCQAGRRSRIPLLEHLSVSQSVSVPDGWVCQILLSGYRQRGTVRDRESIQVWEHQRMFLMGVFCCILWEGNWVGCTEIHCVFLEFSSSSSIFWRFALNF